MQSKDKIMNETLKKHLKLEKIIFLAFFEKKNHKKNQSLNYYV